MDITLADVNVEITYQSENVFPCCCFVNISGEFTTRINMFHIALTLYAPCSCVPVVFFAQVQAMLLRGVLGGTRVCVHWLLLHLNQMELAG